MLRRVTVVRTKEPHGVTSQKTSFFIVTAVKTSQKAVFFGPTWYYCVEKIINSYSTATAVESYHPKEP
jgi:hypothetical protein